MRMCYVKLLVAAVVVTSLGIPNTSLAQDDKAAMLKHLQEGIQQFESGDYDKAAAALTEVMKLQPDSEVAFELIEKVEEAKLISMIGNEKTRALAVRLLTLAEQEAIRKKIDPEAIKKSVTKLSGEFEMRWEGISELVQVGDCAVPYLLPLLDVEKPTDQSAFAALALKKIGWKAVLPLVEALNCEKRFLKQNVCAVLGQIGDVRAMPALKAICEDAKQPAEVTTAAASAIQAISGKPVSTLKPAAQLFYDLGLQYYYEDISVMRFVTPTMFTWRWCPTEKSLSEKLKYFEEPRYVYSRLQVEEACLDGMAADPHYEPLYELIVLAYCNLIGRTEALLKGPAKLPDDEKKQVEERQQKLERWNNNARAAGSKYVLAALGRALKDEDYATALTCIRVLGEVKDEAVTHPTALIGALSCKDKAVRYAAAEALLGISPAGKLGGTGQAVRVLSQALSEKAKRTVLTIIDDLQQRNRIKAIVASLPYHLLEATTSEEANAKIKMGLPPVDVIIISHGFGKSDTVAYARQLRRSAEAIDAAIVVLAEAKELDAVKEKYGNAAFAVLPADVEKDPLAAKIDEAVKRPEVALDDTAQIQESIRLAAEAVAQLDRERTAYPISGLSLPLAQLLEGYDDAIRIPALRALAVVADEGTLDALLKVAKCTKDPEEVRVEALKAVGAVLERSKEISAERCNCLLSLLDDPCVPVAREAAIAVGRFAPPPALVAKVGQSHRYLQAVPAAAPAPPAAAPAVPAPTPAVPAPTPAPPAAAPAAPAAAPAPPAAAPSPPAAAPAAPAAAGPDNVDALMAMMKANKEAIEAAMKAGDMNTIAMKAKMLAQGARMGKEKFSMGKEMVAAQYDALAAASDAMGEAATAKNNEALMAASQKAMATCMECHKAVGK